MFEQVSSVTDKGSATSEGRRRIQYRTAVSVKRCTESSCQCQERGKSVSIGENGARS